MPYLDVFLAISRELGPVLRHTSVWVEKSAIDEKERSEVGDAVGRRPDGHDRILFPRLRLRFIGVASPNINDVGTGDVHANRSAELVAGGDMALKKLPDGVVSRIAMALDGHVC